VKLSRTPGGVHGPGPALGEHTREVLEALGYSEADAEALADDGAVAGPPSGAQGSFLA
jgi:crotonobetainyl-CoA:carnitine CoA-transferase CaiB-like acyl-CoA transferase